MYSIPDRFLPGVTKKWGHNNPRSVQNALQVKNEVKVRLQQFGLAVSSGCPITIVVFSVRYSLVIEPPQPLSKTHFKTNTKRGLQVIFFCYTVYLLKSQNTSFSEESMNRSNQPKVGLPYGSIWTSRRF